MSEVTLVLDSRFRGNDNKENETTSFSAVFYTAGKNKSASKNTKGVKPITL
jgi:hypothetical protein